MLILSQSRKEIFNLDNCNLFGRDEIIYITEKANLYDGRASVLAKYNSPKEVESVLLDILTKQTSYYIMPDKEEKNEF